MSTADISLADEIAISVSGNKRTRTSYIENIINDYLTRNNIDSMANVDAQALKDLIVDKELFSEVDVNIVGNQIDIMVKDRWTLILVTWTSLHQSLLLPIPLWKLFHRNVSFM